VRFSPVLIWVSLKLRQHGSKLHAQKGFLSNEAGELDHERSGPGWSLHVRVHSFGMIWIRISDHQRSQWICDQSGFIGSFDAPWSKWSCITDPDPDYPKGMHPKCISQLSYCNHILYRLPKLELETAACFNRNQSDRRHHFHG